MKIIMLLTSIWTFSFFITSVWGCVLENSVHRDINYQLASAGAHNGSDFCYSCALKEQKKLGLATSNQEILGDENIKPSSSGTAGGLLDD